MKYFGCKYNKRSNQNLLYPKVGTRYTHIKIISINDDRNYLQFKRKFKRVGWENLSDFEKSYLMNKNPYHFRYL